MMNTFIKLTAAMLLLAATVGCCNCRAYQHKNRQPLVGTEWQLVQLGALSMVPTEDTYTIVFDDQNRISGIGACNRLSGDYTVGEKNSLKIGPLAATRMACPGMENEMAFMQAVESATRYDMDGPMLLLMEGETLRAVFQAKAK